jgi:hypothetical protein
LSVKIYIESLIYNSSIGTALATIMFLKKYYPNVKKLAFVIPDDGRIP